jgi:hypothetical protein
VTVLKDWPFIANGAIKIQNVSIIFISTFLNINYFAKFSKNIHIMYKMKFDASELPYRDFEKVGLSKKDVLALPVDSLNALLSGRRSDFIRINADGMRLDVKTSLYRNPDNSISLRFHPINHVAHNIYNLTDAQLKFLQNGEVKGIVIESKKQNGDPADILVQYDPETKEYVSINVNDIPLPEKINDVKLTDRQRSDWRNGKEIEVGGEPVWLSLTNTLGFVGKIFMFALDGGISIGIAAILKEYNKREAERNSAVAPNEIKSNKKNDVSIDGNDKVQARADLEKIPSVTRQKDSLAPNERTGVLVDFGVAPFQNEKGAKESYFIVLKQGDKETTIWGKGLKEAIEKSQVEKGSEISLISAGRKEVTVSHERRDESGNLSSELISTHRNNWTIADHSQRTIKR